MRHGLRILMALMSCCCLFLNSGCGPEVGQNPHSDDSLGKGADVAPSAPADFGNNVTLPSDQAPVVVTPPVVIPRGPGVVPPSGGGGGGGGGSQGSEKPARTGNPDNDPLAGPEFICDDGIDNDEDGTIDCLDTDCAQKSCNDGNGCTLNDTCVNNICQGDAVNCDAIVGNECTMNTCVSISSEPGNDNFKCNSMLDPNSTDFNSCTPSNNCAEERNPDGTCPDRVDECIVGRCVITTPPNSPPVISCQGADKVDLTVAEGGCRDGEPCHSYACEDGECEIDFLNDILCEDGNPCTTNDICVFGVCEGANVPSSCTADSQCATGSTCEGFVAGACTVNDTACELNTDCAANTCVALACSLSLGACMTTGDCPVNTCAGFEAGICTCSDGNDCTLNDQCNGSGRCVGGDDGVQPCTVAADCASGSCVNNLCVCSDGNDCTVADACGGGECNGSVQPDTCIADADCGAGGNCVGEAPGVCTSGGGPCFTTPCNMAGLCLGATLGACACDEGIPCTTNTCTAGACVVSDTVDAACVTDGSDPCTEQICEPTGCKSNLMDGQLICSLTLANLSPTLDAIVTNAGIADLSCSIGRLQCVAGDSQGACTLNETFPVECSEATLESSCTIMGAPQDLSPDVAASICEELANLI